MIVFWLQKQGDVSVKCALEDDAFIHYYRTTFTLTQFPYSAIMGNRLSRIPYNSEIKAKLTKPMSVRKTQF